MKKALITAFEPFGKIPFNPTIDVIKQIEQEPDFKNTATAILPVEFKNAAEKAIQLIKNDTPDVVISLREIIVRETLDGKFFYDETIYKEPVGSGETASVEKQQKLDTSPQAGSTGKDTKSSEYKQEGGGLSPGKKNTTRASINLEACGRNRINARIADNRGFQPLNESIINEGEEVLYSGWPVEELAEKLRNEGINAVASNDAGAYVCNEFIYRVNHFILKDQLDTKFGFLHLPWLTMYGEERFVQAFQQLKEEKIMDIEEKYLMEKEEVVHAIKFIIEYL